MAKEENVPSRNALMHLLQTKNNHYKKVDSLFKAEVKDQSWDNWIKENGEDDVDRKSCICHILLSSGHVLTGVVLTVDGNDSEENKAKVFDTFEFMPYIGLNITVNFHQVVAAWDYMDDQSAHFITDLKKGIMVGK